MVLVPMLRRAHRVAPLLATLRATAPAARVLFLLTPHDREVARAVDAAGEERLDVVHHPVGDYARKIAAGYRHTDEPLMFLAADDLEFRPGWFEAATAKLEPGVGVVGTNDGGNPRVLRGEHSTHSFVTRAYADRPGATADQPGSVLCELYSHEWVDDELVGVARKRGVYRHASESLVIHLHPNWRKDVPTDPMYAAQRQRMRQSASLFRRRRQMWI